MQKKKGISLIVLVITIIVMIILAAAIILSLNNAGIIGNANKAVEMTNDKTIQTAADLKYSEYILNNKLAGEQAVGEWIKSELIADNVLTTEIAKMYKITDEGQVIKLEYYDEASYNAYMKELGFEVLDIPVSENGTVLDDLIVSGKTDIEVDSFIESYKHKKIALPYGIIKIADYGFPANSPTIVINGVEDPEYFPNSFQFEAIYLPNTIKEIGKQAINAPFTTQVYLPDSIITFGNDRYKNIFSNCSDLTTIHYSGTITEGAPWGATNATIVE